MDMSRQSNGRQLIGFPNLIHLVLSQQCAIRPLVGDEELIGRPMYLWRIREASVTRDVSPQQVMYHNIDQSYHKVAYRPHEHDFRIKILIQGDIICFNSSITTLSTLQSEV